MVKTIGEIFDLFAGGDVDKGNFSIVKDSKHPYPVYSNALQNEGLYGYTAIPRYRGNSITITGRGSVGTPMYRAGDFDAIIRLLVLTPKDKSVCVKFVSEYMRHCIAFPQESTGVPQLTVPQIRDIELSLPLLAEQKLITAVLSDMDAYIVSLEKLIAKKRAIKQGAMQELLTGKRRLSGFSGEWMEKKVGDISDVTKLAGFEFTAHIVYSDRGRIIALRGLNVKFGKLNLDEMKYIDGSNFAKLSRSKLIKGDMLFTYVGTIGDVALVDGNDKYYLAPNVALIRFRSDINPQFMLYQFMSDDFMDSVINPLIASTTQAALSMKNIRLFDAKIPSFDEQTAIAEILSCMDAELDALSAKRAKAQQLKQGMMHELLTGNIKLTEEATDNGEN